MNDIKKLKICIDQANQIKTDLGLESVVIKQNDLTVSLTFSQLWVEYGLFDLDIPIDKRQYSIDLKFNCLQLWVKNLFPDDLFDINYLHRKVLNNDKTNFINKNTSMITATSEVLFEYNGKNYVGVSIDLVPNEIDKYISNISEISKQEIIEIKFNEYIETAEKNLSYHNDLADETALKYFKIALELRPNENELKNTVATLDKIINHKNYSYAFDDRVTFEFAKLFVDCCNVKGFERLYEIISDDFVFIGKYFGRTKKGFIDSIYIERKSWQGLMTKIGKYTFDNRQIPCIILNDYGVLFLDIDKGKIVRAFDKKIGETIDKNTLTEWNE
ncbi:MAG: hypothetical protein EAZ53_02710 [Bacteroidetes bacterium]|nr:MAG: hypothetical protein EAZ53_02710 [Bacteroidota bacterium]